MLHKSIAPSDQVYLQRLGEEVRKARRGQRMNRKSLAARSGVSERYLAQLESGRGNISIVRLRHIAQALDCPISSLLDRDITATRGHDRKNRIALIGLRGAGKSTLGRLIADELGIAFAELTERIERSSGLDLSDIFNLYGAEGYRRLEQRELLSVIDEYDACVLASAGGISENNETFELLLANFETIWLTATPQEHLDRVVAQGDTRPIDGHHEALLELKAIMGNRARDYARAEHIIDTAGRSVNEVMQQLLDRLPLNSP